MNRGSWSGFNLRRRGLGEWVFATLLVAQTFVGCSCARTPVNANPGLRWWLFSSFGAEMMCPEILKTGAPLRLDARGAAIGRFFPNYCRHVVDDANKTVTLHLGGTGYAWTPVAGRVGFQATASVEYRMDFFLAEDAVYVWGKAHRIVSGPTFQIGSIENPVADWAASSTPVGYLAQTFGTQIAQSQISEGFTVIRGPQGDEFALGHLEPPERPLKAIDLEPGERIVYANESTEVRAEQVDFLGPYEIGDDDQALFVRLRARGPQAEVLVYPRAVADRLREGLQRGAALAPPPEPPVLGFAIQPGPEQRQRLPLKEGQYFLVVDNSSRLGVVQPPWSPWNMVGASSLGMSYVVELGDADEAP